MRILQVAPVPREIGGINTGGIATHAWGLSTHLAQAGHDVAVLADNRPYAEPWPESVDGVAVYGGRSFRGSRRTRSLSRPATLAAVASAKRRFGPAHDIRWVTNSVAGCAAAIEHFGPDIIHVHALETRYAVADAVRGEIPMVATAHSTHYVDFAERDARDSRGALITQNLATSRDIIFVSEWIAERYRAVFPDAVERVRSHVLPNPIDALEYEPVSRDKARASVGADPDETLLLSVGNLIPRKAPLTLVRAAGILRDQGVGVRIIMIGEGPLRGEVEALVAELDLLDRVELIGHAPQELMTAYYGAADVFVFPSLMETWGLAAVEAMLSGCPVVGTYEVMPEVVPDFAGVYVPSAEASDLAAGIRVALERDWDAHAIREHALGFDWTRRVGGFEDVYQMALEGSRT